MLLLECVSNGSKNKTRDFRASKFTACLKDVLFSPSVCVRLCMCARVFVCFLLTCSLLLLHFPAANGVCFGCVVKFSTGKCSAAPFWGLHTHAHAPQFVDCRLVAP